MSFSSASTGIKQIEQMRTNHWVNRNKRQNKTTENKSFVTKNKTIATILNAIYNYLTTVEGCPQARGAAPCLGYVHCSQPKGKPKI